MKSAKDQVNAKQYPEAELLLFENYSDSSSKLSSKTKQVCLRLSDYTINHNENEDENKKNHLDAT